MDLAGIAVFLLLLWKWIDVSSTSVFAKRSLKTFSNEKMLIGEA